MASFHNLIQLSYFYYTDHEVYERLVFKCGFDPHLSKRIVAFWYWLERRGFRKFIFNMSRLSLAEFNGIALEAILCLEFLNKDWHLISVPFDIHRYFRLPNMSLFLGQDFFVGQLYADRAFGKQVMEKFLKDVCDRVFINIQPRNLTNGYQNLPALTTYGFQIQPVITNGFQVQSLVANGVNQVHQQNGYRSNMVIGQENNNATQDMCGDSNVNDRTLFITFSKGHPISKEELGDLIVRIYGNCIEDIHMGIQPEPLFARVVVNSVSAMKKILGDEEIVKLNIKGKDVWLRRFVPNSQQVSSSKANRN